MSLDVKPHINSSSDRYSHRLKAEIEYYRAVDNVHDLPGIFHVWSADYVRPKIESVMGISLAGMEEFYAKYILQYAKEHPSDEPTIISIGAGNGDLEIRIAQLLKASGLASFHFDCMDINPAMLARARDAATQYDLNQHFTFLQLDVREWAASQSAGIVMAHHSLHHIQELEKTFANIQRVIGEDGYFLTCDMIGRNGHMRWPEALAVVENIWKTVPDRYKYDHQRQCFQREFDDVDCSAVEGFEGIRAQDILPLLLTRFYFDAFVAYGNIPDVFVDRSYGHNLKPDNPDDVAFIHRIGDLNDRLISEGVIKPTQMMAVMRTRPLSRPRYFLHWSPAFCVRTPPLYRGVGANGVRSGDGSPVNVVGAGRQESAALGFWQDGWISDEFAISIRAKQPLEAVIIQGFLPECRQEWIELSVRVNASLPLTHRVTAGPFSLGFPVEVLQGEVLQLQIVCGNSFCPAQSGTSTDNRILAVVLREIKLV